MANYNAVRDAMIKASGELNLLRQVMEKRMKDDQSTDPNALPLELMPEGHVFRGLTRTAHCWKQELARTWDWSVISGKGSTPRAAFVAAVEAAKVEG